MTEQQLKRANELKKEIEEFLNKRIGGFVPLVIKGGKTGGRNSDNKLERL